MFCDEIRLSRSATMPSILLVVFDLFAASFEFGWRLISHVRLLAERELYFEKQCRSGSDCVKLKSGDDHVK